MAIQEKYFLSLGFTKRTAPWQSHRPWSWQLKSSTVITSIWSMALAWLHTRFQQHSRNVHTIPDTVLKNGRGSVGKRRTSNESLKKKRGRASFCRYIASSSGEKSLISLVWRLGFLETHPTWMQDQIWLRIGSAMHLVLLIALCASDDDIDPNAHGLRRRSHEVIRPIQGLHAECHFWIRALHLLQVVDVNFFYCL